MNRKKRPTIGLALGSGGAKGLSHIGVIKTLEAHHIPIDFIAGSSIGALIGAHYAVYQNSQKLEDVALGFNSKKGFMLFDPTLRGGIIKGNKIETLIAELLSNAAFSEVKIPFSAVATDFNSGNAVALTKGNLTKAVRASISVPTFFQPVFFNDLLLADGGLSNPVPVDVVRAMGADIVIGVNLDSVQFSTHLTAIPSLTRIPQNSIDILRHNLALYTVKTADIIIEPKRLQQVGLIGWNVFFNTQKAKTIIASGEEAANNVIKKLLSLINEKQKHPLKRLLGL